jgi:hypothetical protein
MFSGLSCRTFTSGGAAAGIGLSGTRWLPSPARADEAATAGMPLAYPRRIGEACAWVPEWWQDR